MRAAAIEVSDGIGLEAVAVDDVGRRSFPLRAFAFVFIFIFIFIFVSASGLVFFFGFGFVQFFWSWILQHEDQALAVGGPGEVVDILRRVGEALGFAAHAVEEPDLRLAFIALGEES